MTTFKEGLALAERGFHIFPLDHPDLPKCIGMHGPSTPCDGVRGKHNYVKYTEKASRDPKTIAMWFTGHKRNVGIFCDASGLLIVDEDLDGVFTEYANSVGETVPDTFTVATGKGHHYYFAAPPGVELGNKEGALHGLGINIRSGNAYGVGPTSQHASGRVYTIDRDVPIAATPQWLIDAILTKKSKQSKQADGAGWETYGYTPALDLVPDVIKGPIAGRQNGERHQVLVKYASSLRARNTPDGEAEILMENVWRRCQQPPACDTELTLEEALGKLRDIYERYDVSGNYKTAADGDQAQAADGDQPSEPTTWEAFDLTEWLSGERKSPQPTVGISRSDGQKFIYPGKEHTVYGETEAGKSWFALDAAVELRMGRDVLYIHYEEGDPGSTIERLLLLAVPPDAVKKHLRFVAPARPGRAGWLQELLDPPPALAVHDGVNEAMSLHGDDIYGADGAAAFRRNLIKPCLAVGASTISCDHVTKSSEGRGRYAYGSGHKINAVDGAAFMIENIEPFGRGLRGASSVYVTKDRPGQLRAHGKPTGLPGKTLIGVLAVDDTGDSEDFLTFWAPKEGDAPADGHDDVDATSLMEVLHSVVASRGSVPSKSQIVAAAANDGHKFRRADAFDAINRLFDLGRLREVRNGAAKTIAAVEKRFPDSPEEPVPKNGSGSGSPIGGEPGTVTGNQFREPVGTIGNREPVWCRYCGAELPPHMHSQQARGYCNSAPCIAASKQQTVGTDSWQSCQICGQEAELDTCLRCVRAAKPNHPTNDEDAAHEGSLEALQRSREPAQENH
jgi:hypothetical protein